MAEGPHALAMLLGTLVVGCGEVDATPPTLLDTRFAPASGAPGPDRIVLSFSEALGPIGDVEPDHFRISTGLVIDDPAGNDLSVYYDLANHFDNGLPGFERLDDPQPRHDFTVVAELERTDDPRELVLVLSYPLELSVCEALIMAEDRGIPHGIFVHYAEAEHPRIVDEAGNALADISPDFVHHPTGLLTAPGHFEGLDTTLALECPDPI